MIKKLKNTTGLTLKTVITAEVHINYTTLQKHPHSLRISSPSNTPPLPLLVMYN